MKILLLQLISLFSYSVCYAQKTDEELIKQVINSAYISGIQNGGSVDDVRKGIHPGFNLLRFIDNDLKPYPIEEWIVAIEKRRQESNTPTPKVEGKFINIDVTGTAAVAKLELYREGKKIFTDYIALYKFNEGWRIVSKTFYRHP